MDSDNFLDNLSCDFTMLTNTKEVVENKIEMFRVMVDLNVPKPPRMRKSKFYKTVNRRRIYKANVDLDYSE